MAALLEVNTSCVPSLNDTNTVLALAQHLAWMTAPANVLVLARGTHRSNAAHGGAGGVSRVLRLEHAALRMQSTGVSRDSTMAAATALLGVSSETEVRWSRAARHVVRLRACATASR